MMKRIAVSGLLAASLSACVANGQGSGSGPQGLNLFASGSQTAAAGTTVGPQQIGSVHAVGQSMAKLGFSQAQADEAMRALERGFADVRAGRGSPAGNRLCNDSKAPAAVSIPITGGKVAVCKVVGTDSVVQFAVYGPDAKGRQGKRLLGDVTNSGGGWQVNEIRGG